MDPVLLCKKCEEKFAPDTRIQSLPVLHSDRLRSNQLPSHTEIHQTLSYLQLEESELERCDQELHHLRKAIEQLDEYRRTLLRRAECRRYWLSPIRRLPAEILEEIFAIVCLRQPYSLDIILAPNDTTLPRAPTLIFAQICHRWRQVVNGSARLWSSIRVDPFIGDKAHALVEHYLTKSKEHPLNIELSGDFFLHSGAAEEQASCSKMIKALYPHFSHIEQFNFSLDRDIFAFTHAPNTLSFPSLKSFRNSGKLSSDIAPSWFWAILRCAPRLTDVESDILLGESMVPYSQLTTLEVTEPSDYGHLVATLKLCSSLQSLTVDVSGSIPVTLNTIRLASLRHLSLTVLNKSILSTFLRQFIFSSLISLAISVTIDTHSTMLVSPIPSLMEFVRRSGCQLNKFMLSTNYLPTSYPELSEFLGLCPGMSHLGFDISTGDMDSKSFTRTLLDVLQQAPASDSQETQSVLIPRLFQLDVAEEIPRVGKDTVSVFLDMIESRNTRRKDLGKELCINLDFGGPYVLTADLTTRLKELEANGVKCHLE